MRHYKIIKIKLLRMLIKIQQTMILDLHTTNVNNWFAFFFKPTLEYLHNFDIIYRLLFSLLSLNPQNMM